MQQDLTNDKLNAEVKGFLTTLNLSTQAKEVEALLWWNSNKSQHPHLANFATTYHLELTSSVHSERIFSEAGNLYAQKRNCLLSKTGKKLLFHNHNLQKPE